jgi:hypothetical protein
MPLVERASFQTIDLALPPDPKGTAGINRSSYPDNHVRLGGTWKRHSDYVQNRAVILSSTY